MDLSKLKETLENISRDNIYPDPLPVRINIDGEEYEINEVQIIKCYGDTPTENKIIIQIKDKSINED